jgi:electron transfer flavoprotein alpha/beta subunit
LNANILKLIGAAGLNGLWAALVFTGKADAQPLIAAIGTQLTALLGYHAVTNLQATPKQ